MAPRSGLLYVPAKIIQMMAFTQIIAIWTPEISLQDHLNDLLGRQQLLTFDYSGSTVCVGLWVGVYRVKLQDLLGLYLSDHSYLM